MDTQQEMTKEFQPLFNLILDEHNLILTMSEMEDIIIAVQKFLKQNKKNKQNGVKTKSKYCGNRICRR